MSNTYSPFVGPSDVLPGWMNPARLAVGRNGQFRPMDVPVGRPQQLTIEQAMGDGLQFGAAGHGEAPRKPATHRGTGHADHPGDSGLAASGEKSVLNGGASSYHADIVAIASAKCQSIATDSMIKLSMDVWTHIEQELHRRRLNAAWLGRKLGASRQVISGWKKRGVPTARYEQIAELLGWTMDRLATGIDDTPAPPPVAEKPAAVESIYSPMALDVARMVDNIPSIEQKRRAYALILQITAMDSSPSPIVPEPKTAVPDLTPKPSPARAK